MIECVTGYSHRRCLGFSSGHRHPLSAFRDAVRARRQRRKEGLHPVLTGTAPKQQVHLSRSVNEAVPLRKSYQSSGAFERGHTLNNIAHLPDLWTNQTCRLEHWLGSLRRMS